MTKKTTTPTLEQYGTFDEAYSFFNKRLFGGELPLCLFVFGRGGKNNLGYFSPERWSKRKGKDRIDEISVNPMRLRERSDRDIMSTLVHEMCHVWQQHFGKPSKNGYHNKQWGTKMDEVGLCPSNTGEEGGKRTGQQMTHFIVKGGPFDKLFAEFSKSHSLGWIREIEPGKAPAERNKIKYTCPGCELNVWGKPDINIVCGECDNQLEYAE